MRRSWISSCGKCSLSSDLLFQDILNLLKARGQVGILVFGGVAERALEVLDFFKDSLADLA